MQRRVWLVIVGLVASVLAVVVPSGNAQAPGPKTITLFEPEEDAGGSFRIIDNAPKSPSKNPESRKYRFSVGDQAIFSNPVYDRQGGTSQGNVYVKATVVKGKTFANVRLLAEAVIAFNDNSQLVLDGLFSFADEGDVRVAVTGGTGTYEGASGTLTITEVPGGSLDTITLK